MLERARSLADELVYLRRDVHRHPELAFQEVRTARLVADTLREIGGITVRTGVGRTGVIGELGNGAGPTIAIRADMDALPIMEDTGVDFASEHDGIMHACGHDAHTAMLLGAAHLLRQSYADEPWQGTVRFLFQPAEEAADEDGISGATAMIDDGALEKVDAVIALHVASTEEAGKCIFQDGPSHAAVDSFSAQLRGTGGHGAYPHKTTDPLFMLGPVLNALYAIPSRRIDPLDPSVVSLGKVCGGSASNVIPATVQLEGTIRSFSEEVRRQLWHELEQALALSRHLGGDYALEIHEGYPAMTNDRQVNRWLREVARDLAGEGFVSNERFGMGAEDFAYMVQQAPGAMFMLGAALPDDVKRAHHTPIFNIDERVLPLGAAILAETARRFLRGELS